MNVLFYAYGAVIGFAIGLVTGVAVMIRNRERQENS